MTRAMVLRRATDQPELAKLGVRVVRDRDYWSTMITQAAYYYGSDPEPGRVSRAWWGMIGLMCYGIDRAYRYLSAWNRS